MRFRTHRSRGRGASSLLGGRGGSLKMRLLIGGGLALVALFSYWTASDVNPITGESQRISMEEVEEVRLGLASAPQMASEFGGVSSNAQGQRLLEEIGRRLVAAIPEVYPQAGEIPWEFSFTLLEDDQTVNAFALPGGPTFITDALFDRLETEDELAGVMGHEIVHVIQRHGAERMHKQNLLQGLAGAAVAGTGEYTAAEVVSFVGNFKMMSYGRDQETQCDLEGLKLMAAAGYDPYGMVRVMEVLAGASGGASGPEWASSHPSPEGRIETIKREIQRLGLGDRAGVR
ncbi:M48 family metalloprotease [Phycisphaera mikurensis]|uniref:Peptidase M48 family protein n=1 Tax=Phycisphaera mikurensis (strain NBRC 102666 / KCTC 22515 / FYK2301M01) TaxID=1142394 RepID=I0IIE5_PHYMF|nr:M48 family metalloprotease [Phycisphaera mikurensis]MBB6442403.1 putative Zn-dependent protease [Phycisphaera mikurensis]BAM05033.1 peptidase M48 family protein [Phycisphaera mikurensis NBRC 102666]